jgi:hypothetical protein
VEVPGFGVAAGEVAWPAEKALAGGDVTCSLDGNLLARAYLFAFVEDGSFEKLPPPAEGAPFDGRSFLRFGPAKAWQGHAMRLNLEPARAYRASVMGRRTGTKGQIHGLVRMKSRARGWQHASLDFPKDRFNEWVKLQATFTTPADMTEADLYLYNCNSEETVDYDLLVVEIIRPATP